MCRQAVKDLGVTYPVALDNNLAIWQAFNNQYWPAHYFIDAEGRIRHHHFGEGEYDQSERVIQQLLREAGTADVPGGIVDPKAQGVQAAAARRTAPSRLRPMSAMAGAPISPPARRIPTRRRSMRRLIRCSPISGA